MKCECGIERKLVAGKDKKYWICVNPQCKMQGIKIYVKGAKKK